jgi:hypothetical protein
MSQTEPQQTPAPSAFEREAQHASPGTLREIALFLRQNKKWWLIPIVVAVVLVGALVLISGTALAPFIYTLF